MKHCPRCGKSYDSPESVCSNCMNEMLSNHITPPPTNNPNNGVTNKQMRMPLIIIGSCLAAFLLIIFLISLFRTPALENNNHSEAQSGAVTSTTTTSETTTPTTTTAPTTDAAVTADDIETLETYGTIYTNMIDRIEAEFTTDAESGRKMLDEVFTACTVQAELKEKRMIGNTTYDRAVSELSEAFDWLSVACQSGLDYYDDLKQSTLDSMRYSIEDANDYYMNYYAALDELKN